jgi:predicted Fe-Mo cluster-binding NifX family protein
MTVTKNMVSICADSTDENGFVSDRFARCNFYSVYNHEDLTFEFIENEAKDEMSGAGGKAAKQISSLGVQVALVPEVGPKAYAALEAFDIEVFQYQKGTSVRDAIYAYYAKQLKPITAPNTKSKHGQ